jgi:hypothetical protein
MQPQIHDGVKLRKNNLPAISAAGKQKSPNRKREEEKAGAFIAVIIIVEMNAMPFPV